MFGPRGRLYLTRYISSEKAIESIFTCLSCRACEFVCPSRLSIADILNEARRIILSQGMNSSSILRRVRDIADIIRKSLEERGVPLPIDKKACVEWAKGLEIPKGGKTILYTSCMYQLLPYMTSIFGLYERVGGGEFPIVRPLAEAIMRLIRPDSKLVERVNLILRRIVSLLRRANVEFGYLYEDEPYSGALLYELGLIDDFVRHAEKVVRAFKSHGVERIITIDPHTHKVLSLVYPKYVEFPFEVINMFEILRGIEIRARGIDVVIHDSCVYSRYFKIRDLYREILVKAGVRVIDDPYVTGLDTALCCGGPLKPIRPDLAMEIARLRIRQLTMLSNTIVTLCPICLMTLSRASKENTKILDFFELIE